ncbi:MAG: porin family protein [Longimicrobiales bacterium]
MMKLFMAGICCAASALALAAPSALAAQTIGFKGGYTASTQKWPSNTNQITAQAGLGGGGFIRFGAMGISVQAEALALTKGSEEKHESADPNVHLDRDVKIGYIEVPILVRLALGHAIVFSPYVMAGPAFGFKTSCSAGLAEGSSARSDCGSTIKTVDTGMAGVAGIELAAGPGSLLLEGRYTYGLTDVAKTNATGSIKNRSAAVMAGYAIGLH